MAINESIKENIEDLRELTLNSTGERSRMDCLQRCHRLRRSLCLDEGKKAEICVDELSAKVKSRTFLRVIEISGVKEIF